tara:strand:+ start:1232 stop:2347 length:1116 start_codon:yes stop_codon:yes gene_type:complete
MADGLKLNLKDASLLKNAEGTFYEIKGKNSSGASFSWRSPIVITIDVSISQTVSNLRINAQVQFGQTGDLRLDWGDGTTVVINTTDFSFHSHTYSASTGLYDIIITPLSATSSCNIVSSSANIVGVKNFGSLVDQQYSVTKSSSIGSVNLSSVPKSISPKINSLFSVLNAPSGESTFNDVNVVYWGVSNVNNFVGVFSDRTVFNQDISVWDMSGATDVSGMFLRSSSFNQDISTWNISGVTNLGSLFESATSFNQDISTWDTSNVFSMNTTFKNATSFNQDLGLWSINEAISMRDVFSSSGMSTENYSRTLIGWANSHYAGNAKNNVTLGATGVTYNSTAYTTGNQFNDGVSARAYLVGTAGWNITDAGAV